MHPTRVIDLNETFVSLKMNGAPHKAHSSHFWTTTTAVLAVWTFDILMRKNVTKAMRKRREKAELCWKLNGIVSRLHIGQPSKHGSRHSFFSPCSGVVKLSSGARTCGANGFIESAFIKFNVTSSTLRANKPLQWLQRFANLFFSLPAEPIENGGKTSCRIQNEDGKKVMDGSWEPMKSFNLLFFQFAFNA